MSDDIEALLRSGLAERADAAPSFDDLGLADAAIAGAGRIRRRRRVASAASGAGLLVLGAAAFVWQPWLALHDSDNGGDGVTAADTSTVEAQNDLGMEFVIDDGAGSYSVLNENGDSVSLGDAEPTYVYRLNDAYLAESEDEVWTVGFDGTSGTQYSKATEETYTKVNSRGEQYAIITPSTDYETEEYSLFDVTIAEEKGDPLSFTTNYAVTLADWNATTAVFNADLNSVTGGNPGTYYFNDDLEYGLESVSAAGFESALLVDSTDPNNVCVSDFDPAELTASETEWCGPIDSAEVQDELAAASGDSDADPSAFAEAAIEQAQGEYIPLDDIDLGEYEASYFDNMYWTDPFNRWQLSGTPGEPTWLLIDASGEEPELSELEPPAGALMPVLSYT